MFKKNIPYIFTGIYFLLCFITMNLAFDGNKTLQFYIKPLIPLSLFLFYFFSVEKIKIIYIMMLICALVGHVFMIFPEKYFIICLYSYLTFHLLTTILIYKNFLKRKSTLNIFTFSLPFFLAFVTIFIFIYKNLKNDFIPIFISGTTIAINGSVALLNYAQHQNIRNYLIFTGLFTIVAADASIAVYMYNGKDVIFYYLLILFDQLGQYAICRGLILQQNEN